MTTTSTTEIATYNEARSLAHALKQFGIKVKVETFDMKTSGIYIPRWLGYSRIPHEYDPISGIARWNFFLRFEDGHGDINVGEALNFSLVHGTEKLALKIKAKSS